MFKRIIYTTESGEKIKFLPDGRTLIVHRDKPLRVLRPDGKIELLIPWPCQKSEDIQCD